MCVCGVLPCDQNKTLSPPIATILSQGRQRQHSQIAGMMTPAQLEQIMART